MKCDEWGIEEQDRKQRVQEGGCSIIKARDGGLIQAMMVRDNER